jgi:hypothetical protein
VIHWLHHLLNPHCSFCQEREEWKRVCSSCETLKLQLAIANDEKRQLLNSLLSEHKRPEVAAQEPIDYEKLKPKLMTWNVRRQMLEAEDRAKAKILAEQRRDTEKSIKDLEKEVGLEEGVKADA